MLAFLRPEILARWSPSAVVGDTSRRCQRWLKGWLRAAIGFAVVAALIERWFDELTDKALPRGAFPSVRDVVEMQATGLAHSTLGQATGVYADLTKKGESIVAKARGLQADDVKADVQKAAADVKVEEITDDVQPAATKAAAKKGPAKKV